MHIILTVYVTFLGTGVLSLISNQAISNTGFFKMGAMLNLFSLLSWSSLFSFFIIRVTLFCLSC